MLRVILFIIVSNYITRLLNHDSSITSINLFHHVNSFMTIYIYIYKIKKIKNSCIVKKLNN